MIEIASQILYQTQAKTSFQPFWERVGLAPRKCSSLLQRRVVDFSSHRSFRGSVEAIEEHYGVIIPCTAVQQVTQDISQKAQQYNATVTADQRTSERLIVQLDGSMVPIVEYSQSTSEQQQEGLKRIRECHWKEFRLCTVSLPTEAATYYGVTRGTPFEAGCMMYQTAQQKGMNDQTRIHGVADGAPWIAEQYEVHFGERHDFILDFYHTSEYLAEASKTLPDGMDSADWFREKQNQLKKGESLTVITELHELSGSTSEQSALSVAAQYLGNRKDQLEYHEAIKQDLPIGSGEVESGHRSVLQARLKKTGAWWKLENAESMSHLKVLQANQNWEPFWQSIAA